MAENETTPAAPDATPATESTWAEDARDLLAYCGADWVICRAHDDPLTLICERTIGTEVRIVAGTPAVCLRRIKELPAEPSRPADLTVTDPWGN